PRAATHAPSRSLCPPTPGRQGAMMADQGMIRGYSIKKQLDYVRSEHFDAATRDRILAQLPPQLRGDMSHLDPAGWYPRDDSAKIYRAVASVGTSEKDVRRIMVTLGEFIAEESANTFLKLVMRLMNPVRFANKLPSLWERDMRGGYFTSDTSKVDERQLSLTLEEIGGYDH